MPCLHCGKETPEYLNYCDWDCLVAAAKAAGGRVHTPNGLPIMCVKYDNLMLECEHGDHEDYKFPVTVEYIGPPTEDEQEHDEWHAVVYVNESIVVTIYECCYAMWSLRDGQCVGGSLWKANEWKLDLQGMQKFLAVGVSHD